MASLTGMIILSPVLLIIGLLILVKMGRPVIFCQERAGRFGRSFTLYKFRTMVRDHSGSTVSVKGESRITPLGARMRRYKLDEFPELWNVLKGDMSFVGPRPDMKEYASKLTGEDRLILELRPGITGPATLKYANEEELLASAEDPRKFNDEVLWPDKVKINLHYYYNRSFFGDIRVILKTILRA